MRSDILGLEVTGISTGALGILNLFSPLATVDLDPVGSLSCSRLINRD